MEDNGGGGTKSIAAAAPKFIQLRINSTKN
jgi:hypothetical protein